MSPVDVQPVGPSVAQTYPRAWAAPWGPTDPGDGWTRVVDQADGAAWEAEGRHGRVRLVVVGAGGADWSTLQDMGECEVTFESHGEVAGVAVDVATCIPDGAARTWLGWRDGALVAVAVPEGERVADSRWIDDVVARVWSQIRRH